ncbi:hypothetical protein D9619_008329 [Psilocybe cf. subviscida]|uniref:Halogenase n=1 Tax=Psilocybe cf. subviscida TaxID=2480587 RepID=A0A8H5B9K0_9AGAR|nr:hypothetical protein D9619_008329 [Psilocybe cf. subviscida]
MDTARALPIHTTVLIIGGGPAGAYSASVLAREKVDVTVLEAAQFPRYHIGESMLPSINAFYAYIGAEKKLRNHGFCPKPGAAVKLMQGKREAYTNFVERNELDASYNVVRSELDELLLRHSQECGAKVYEKTRVLELTFEDDDEGQPIRPIGANYVCGGQSGSISFDYLIDASGSKGIMSTKYLRNRKMNQTLHNIACWGYWTGGGTYMPGTYRHNAPWFEALLDESGWAWYIPLSNGTASVGFVMDKTTSIKKKGKLRDEKLDEYSLKAHYLDQMQFTPGLRELLKNATLKEDIDEPVKSASDYSYSASSYAGDYYRLVGDAAAFIDPCFSSGVHLAYLGGLSAAMTVCASIRKDCTEAQAARYHDVKVATSYTRFLIVVLSAYKQIRSQVDNVLADVDEDNYDRAFDFFRPVIQGTADVGKKLTEDEVQKAIEYCTSIFLPGDPEIRESVGERIGFDHLSANTPILDVKAMEKIAGPDDLEALLVLKQVNARKPLVGLYSALASFQGDVIGGHVARLEHGCIGLARAALS